MLNEDLAGVKWGFLYRQVTTLLGNSAAVVISQSVANVIMAA